jgi:hypothetical protein
MKEKDEDEISINSERFEFEEKSVSEKIKKHVDISTNLVISATFSRKNSKENLNNYGTLNLIIKE